MGVADHLKKGVRFRLVVDGPLGVENLMSAVFRIDLREHDELRVGRVALHLLVSGHEVVDFFRGHSEAPLSVSFLQGFGAVCHEGNRAQWGGLGMLKQIVYIGVDGFGHTVMEYGQAGSAQ